MRDRARVYGGVRERESVREKDERGESEKER